MTFDDPSLVKMLAGHAGFEGFLQICIAKLETGPLRRGGNHPLTGQHFGHLAQAKAQRDCPAPAANRDDAAPAPGFG